MAPRTDLYSFFAFAVSVVSVLAASGCGAIGATPPRWFEPDDRSALAQPATAKASTYTVEIRAEGRHPEELPAPLNGTLHVQDALEQSGAAKRFRKMTLFLVRTTPEGDKHKLEVAYDSRKRRVAPHFDYALHPGDRLVVIEESASVFDQLLDTAVGPLSRF